MAFYTSKSSVQYKHHSQIPFQELGVKCTLAYDLYKEMDNPYARISQARKDVSTEVDTFTSRYLGSDPTYAVSILDGIQSTILASRLTTKDGEDYDYNRAKADLAALDSKNIDRAEYFAARSSLGSLIDPLSLYKSFVVSGGDRARGMHEILVRDSRKYLGKQYQKPYSTYGGLTPLYLQPFKMRGYGEYKVKIPYSHWHHEYLYLIVHLKLFVAMVTEFYKPSVDEIVEAREISLRAGAAAARSADGKRNPSSAYGFYGQHELTRFPDYARMMLAQVWCAHPNNRSPYMVLDPYNWDEMPDQLVSTDVILPEPKLQQTPSFVNVTRNDNLPF